METFGFSGIIGFARILGPIRWIIDSVWRDALLRVRETAKECYAALWFGNSCFGGRMP